MMIWRMMVVVVRIFHLDSGGEDAAIVSWVFNLVLRVGCLGSAVIIFESMIISLYIAFFIFDGTIH